MHAKNTGRRGAFSLLEVMIGITILGLVAGTIALAGLTSSNLFKVSVQRTSIETQVRRSLDRLRSGLLTSGLNTLDPRPADGVWASSLTFDQMRSVTDAKGIVQWRPMRVELRMEDGEVDDDVDNNGNGLVDERRLVLIRDFGEASEREMVLTRWVRELQEGEVLNGADDNGNGLVDEAGFCLNLRGNTIDLYLSLEGIDHTGASVVRTLSTSVVLRN